MRKLFIVVAGGNIEAERHFEDTIQRRRNIDEVRKFLPENETRNLEVLSKCESNLPSEILAKVNEFEKAEKLNPPQEKRAKKISLTDLDSEGEKIQKNIELLMPPTQT